MREVILLAVVLPLAIATHLLGYALTGSLLGFRVKSFNLFYGKALHTFPLREFPIRLGWIPTGGSVEFDESFSSARFFPKMMVSFAGPLALILMSAACLRYDRAGAALFSGFAQLFQGALFPLSTGRTLVADYFRHHGGSVPEAYGVLAAKLAAFNLLPIPPLNGGQIILASIPADSRWFFRSSIIGFLLAFAMSLSWLVALGAYFLGV